MNPHALLVEAAERWGTPLYVTDLDAASSAAHAWRDALPGALVAYAVKANPDPALLRRLAADGFGFEVVGPVELALALRAGGTPERIVVNGVGQTDGDLPRRWQPARSSTPSRSARSRRLIAAGGPGRIGLRINPGLDARHASAPGHRQRGRQVRDRAGRAAGGARGASDRPAARRGPIGAHIGSAIADLGAVRAPGRRSCDRLADEAGAERIDLGGGFAGSPAEWAAAIRPHLPDPARLIVEPGRSIVPMRAGCSPASSVCRRAAT